VLCVDDQQVDRALQAGNGVPGRFEGVMKMAEQAATPSNFEKVRARLT